MALDFPDSPSNGDYYEGFVYDSTAGAWRVSKLPAQGIFAVLAVGGGGGGGAANNRGGGGGGAGEFFEGTLALPNSFLVTVGEGGIAWTAPTNGEDTIIHTLGLRGGDKGGGYTTVGGNSYPFQGGSGGGDDTAAGAGVSIAFPFAQGNNGGDGSTNRGGGGGGASSAGASGAVSGNGGAGVTSTITGSSVGYAGGGGAGFKSGSAGTASDGGGAGGASNDDGTAGTANTGGGGGGASSISTSYDRGGGVGGSGIVILKYPKEITLGIGAGLTSTTSTVGNYKVTQFTAGTDTVTF